MELAIGGSGRGSTMGAHKTILTVGLALGAVAGGMPTRGAVVIHEIMYHPADDNEAAEFLELYNDGPAAASLDNWCIDGLGFCFPVGAMVSSQGFVVLARDADGFTAAYGFSPDYVYATGLSNSGETLTLQDAGGTPRDTVSYADVAPWPVTPDGEGPSLERIDAAADGDTPRNWRAAQAPAGHTASAPNSVAAAGLPPWISNVAFPSEPSPNTPLAVTAQVLDATSVGLTYVINFDAPATLTLHDDGLHNDGAADDGVYGGDIPGQAAGALVRFQIHATGPTGVMRYPRDDDTANYVGTMVSGGSLSTALPVMHWFMDPGDYAAALAHYQTDEMEPAVLFHDGVLYDNIAVRVRGQSSRSYPKKHWKFRLPQSHDFYNAALLQRPVDQFNLQSSYGDKSYCRDLLSYETFRDAGNPYCTAFHTRVQLNGQFFGLYTFVEGMDADYLARQGLDPDAAWYKAYNDCQAQSLASLPISYEKERGIPDDYTDLYDFLQNINSLQGEALRAYLYDHVDLPGMFNYLAATCLLHNNDHVKKNYYLYHDINATGRWVMHPWDMDLTFGRNYYPAGGVLNDAIWADNDDFGLVLVAPSHPLFGDEQHQKINYRWNRFIDRLYDFAEFREMYHRRLRTLMDELLAAGYYETRLAEWSALIAPEAALDRQKWGQYGAAQTLTEAVELITLDYLPRRRHHLFTTHRVEGEIPDAQSAAPTIIINEIMYAPAGNPQAEFVELYNPSTDEAVDLSGWRLQGAAMNLRPGTVLPPDSYLIVTQNDLTFRMLYGSGSFVAGEYSGQLADDGERLVLLNAEGDEVDAVTFSASAPWPTEAAAGGSSLELIDPRRDNDRAGNWAASSAVGGTPGGPNSMTAALPPWPALRLNEILPDNATVNVDETGQPAPWIEIYNESTATIDLGGMYLSNDYAVYDKWMIPPGTQLCGRLWLLLWADGEPQDGPLHTSFALNPLGGTVGLFTADGLLIDHLNYAPLPTDIAFGRYADGMSNLLEMSAPTPDGANHGGTAPMILNEYNAVSSGNLLENDGTDVFWGRVAGNGGDWFELVVTQDHLDIRGWEFVVSNDTGTPNQSIDVLTLTTDNLWTDLRAGTIITVAEQLPDNVSYDPAGNDWWINVQAATGAGGAYITASNFPVSNDLWQLTIRDAGGQVVFGPAGEGVAPVSGIGSDEVFKLEEDPGPFIHPRSEYNDGSSSSFGAPNIFAAGTQVQDFSTLRSVFQPCDNVADCDDGDLCTLDVCTNGECRHLPIEPCYALSLRAEDAASNGVLDGCLDNSFSVALDLQGADLAVNGLQVLIDYDPALLALTAVDPGDGFGSAWDAALEVAESAADGELTYAALLPAAATASSTTVARLHFTVLAPGAARIGFNRGCLPLATKLTLAGSNESAPPQTGDDLTLQILAPDCDDGSICTTADTCWDGVCAGTAVDCDDQDECTTDLCDPLTGCEHVLIDCDTDGVCDLDDNCPQLPNTSQSDTDEDGWGDACDAVFDADHDGDIDLADLVDFVGCIAGPGVPATPTCLDAHDASGDERLDLRDYATMQRVFTGPGDVYCP